MTYSPNFNDPRVVRRTNQALRFVSRFMSPNKISQLSSRWIHHKDNFGKNQLGDYLRGVLLICEDSYYNPEMHYSMKYRLNVLGVEYLHERLKGTSDVHWEEYQSTRNKASQHTTTYCVLEVYKEQAADSLIEEHAQELTTGTFQTSEKNNRSYHPLQNIPNRYRSSKMAAYGYIYEYDIQACAPTLLIQYAHRNGFDKPTPLIDQFLKDRTSFRQDIAKNCQVTEAQAKQVITALFQGAQLNRHHTNRILRETLNNNVHQVTLLQRDSLLTALRSEIRSMWQTIYKTLPRTSMTTSRGQVKKKAITGKEKTELYTRLERDVRKVIERYLKKTNNTSFGEHDGWRCKEVVDITELRSYVKSHTGYSIEIDWNKIDS